MTPVEIALEALEKIADPRKRDHKEPDDYTEKGCLMHIANEALLAAKNKLELDAVKAQFDGIKITKEMLLRAMPDHPNGLHIWLETWERLYNLSYAAFGK